MINKKGSMAITQILILVAATFAFAYIIHENIGALEKSGVYDKENEKDNFLDNVVLLFGSLIKNLGLIPNVAAQSSQDNCCTIGGVACQNVNASEIYRCDSGINIYPQACEFDNRCVGTNLELTGEIASYCCPLTNEGATCQMTVNTEIDEICAVPYLSTSCEATSECNLGCCIDDDFGTCTPMSTQRKCSGENVRFVGDSENDKSCVDLNIADNPCVKGCCILDGNAFFETRQACNFRAGDAYEGDPFNSEIKTEYECIAEVQKLVRGACVFFRNDGGKGCSFMTGGQCTQNGGSLAPNKLCTDQILNTTCMPTEQTTCVEGRDEIYFVDSCNNIANIYDADMVFDESDSATVSYWNDIVSKENSCGSDSINGNSGSSTCGNCNRYLGSFCGESEGGNICKDLNCPASEETGDVPRLNHESWCVYDGAIGNGKDTPGSRHWKRICIDGEVRVEPCADYRGQICAESIINDESGNDFSIATCKVNEAIECLNYNFQETEGDSGEEEDAARQESINKMIEQCNSNVDCFVKNIDAADKFKFDICVPRYPRGFDLNAEERTLSDELCSIASRTCTAIKQKTITGSWKWVANEDCTKAGFADKMNDLCMSIGDCGASVNYVGELSENYQIKKSPRLTQAYIEKISQYYIPVPGQHAIAPNLSDIINASGIPLNFEGSDEELYRNQTLALLRQIGTYAGAIGIVGKVIGFLGAGAGTAGSAAANAPMVYTANSFGWAGTTYSAQVAPGQIAPAAASQGLSFLGALSGLGIGATVGFMAVKFFGLQGDAAVAAVVGGMLAGGVSGLLGATTFWSGGTSAFVTGLQVAFTAFIWAIIVVVIIKKIYVEFKCNSWEAPAGGDNCDECNDNDLFPCTEYRCASLGQACILVNEDSKFARCEEINPDDVTPPIISAGSVETGYKFENEIVNERVDIRQENGGCIPEFTFVEFDLDTDEVAKCKYGISSDMTYDEMEFSNIDTKYGFNHTFEIQMPSLDSLDVRDLEGDIIEMIGAKKLYFKCQDIQGNQNTRSYLVDLCVESGPDLTAPRVESVYPVNGASLRMNVTNVNLIMNLNEPAECNFDYENLPYEEMYYNLSCSHYADEVTAGGYPCFGRIENLTRGENTFWFKCKDQPWLDDEDNILEGTRNTMSGYEYKLIVTENALSIDSVSPQGEIVRGFEPIILIDAEITTSGGVDNGVAQCSLSQRGFENGMVRFQHSLADSHRQTGLQYTQGQHKLYFMCVDTVGNAAYNETNFSIRVDSEPPQVVRVLHRSGLEIITNEEAKCYYSNNNCNFNIDDEGAEGKNIHSMTNVLDVVHHAPWTEGLVYYIKCEDIFGNVNGECAIQVSPSGEF